MRLKRSKKIELFVHKIILLCNAQCKILSINSILILLSYLEPLNIKKYMKNYKKSIVVIVKQFY